MSAELACREVFIYHRWFYALIDLIGTKSYFFLNLLGTKINDKREVDELRRLS